MGVITNPCPDLSTVSANICTKDTTWFCKKCCWIYGFDFMVMLSNENIFHITGHCEGNHLSLVDSPYKGQWCAALMFSLIWPWTNGWANNRDAGDLRCHHAHCDITVNVFAWQEHFCQGMNYWSTLQPKMHGDCLSTDIQIYLHSSTILICCSSLIH